MSSKLISELSKGAWSTITTYTPGDIVTFNGSSYINIATSTNNVPPNALYWALPAQKGDTGPQGAQGTSATISGGVNGHLLSIDGSEHIQDSGYSIIDDDTMAGASPTKLPTSESTKAYVDSLASHLTGAYTSLATTFTSVANTSEQEVTGLATTITDPGFNCRVKAQATINASAIPAGNTSIRLKVDGVIIAEYYQNGARTLEQSITLSGQRFHTTGTDIAVKVYVVNDASNQVIVLGTNARSNVDVLVWKQ